MSPGAVLAAAVASGGSVATQEPATADLPATALAVEPARSRVVPVHERVRVWLMLHSGVLVRDAVSIDGRTAPDQEPGEFAVGGVAGVELPFGEHFAIEGAARLVAWDLEWEKQAGYSKHLLYSLEVAPKVGITLGERGIVQLYLATPLGAGFDPGQHQQFELMDVTVEAAPVFLFGAVGGVQVLFGHAPVGFITEFGPRWAWLSQRYRYEPTNGATFTPASEDVGYGLAWWTVDTGLFVGFE